MCVSHACGLSWPQTEEKRDDGTDNICSARTCTYELSVPDWRVSPEELKERCDHAQTQTQTLLFGKCCLASVVWQVLFGTWLSWCAHVRRLLNAVHMAEIVGFQTI